MVSDAPLFSPSLISPSVVSSLPPNYSMRPLQRSDYHAGFLDVLRVLTTVGDITEAKWDERFKWMTTRNDEYFVLVVLDGEQVVGAGTVLVEMKFIHNLGMVGHIEDIAVAKDQQGKKLGLKIIQALDYVAEKVGCYKASVKQKLRVVNAILEWHGMARHGEQALTTWHVQSILDCSEANEGFYVKCGFKRAGLEMAHYYETPKQSKV